MSKNGCQCADRPCPVDAESAAAASLSVSHNHRKLAGVLRYRGLENEAVMAARLVKVVSLIATLQSVLDDLDASIGVWAGADAGAGVGAAVGAEQADNRDTDIGGHDAQRIGLKHAQFVEGMLEAALSKIHAGLDSGGGHPWESELGFDAQGRATKPDTNDRSTFTEERRA